MGVLSPASSLAWFSASTFSFLERLSDSSLSFLDSVPESLVSSRFLFKGFSVGFSKFTPGRVLRNELFSAKTVLVFGSVLLVKGLGAIAMRPRFCEVSFGTLFEHPEKKIKNIIVIFERWCGWIRKGTTEKKSNANKSFLGLD